jgi:hypothetical protein
MVKNNGIMEDWNNGTMGFRKRESCGLILLSFHPIFHHSNIPVFQVVRLAICAMRYALCRF